MLIPDTVIVHDRELGRTYFGATRNEVLTQFTQFSITHREDGGWSVEARVPGYSASVVLSYSAQFTTSEVVHEASRDALRTIARDYSRFRVFMAQAQH